MKVPKALMQRVEFVGIFSVA